jgi:ferritin-like metal-binding protein YciE
MDKMKDLKDLLRHEVLDLISAEDQMIEAMPAMVERATNPNLKKALTEHLKISERQRKRLDQVTKLLGEESSEDGTKVGNFISNLFGGGDQKCKAMEGLITEGNRMMKEDMNEEVMDAAIISCAQKIEHYEICGYGTAKAFARELQLKEVENLLNETLNEEYEADNRLTKMAVGGGINREAEEAESGNNNSGKGGTSRNNKASSGKKSSSSNSSQAGKKSSSSNSSQAGKKSAGSSSSSGKKGASGSTSGGSSTGKKSSSGSGNSGKKSSSGSATSNKKGASGSSNFSNSSSRGSSAKGATKASAGGNKGASGKKSSGSKGGSSKGGGRGR